ncbi:MAG TPA: dolichyl-phosphate beta-glucosyltransferase [Terriglobales bacterium]|nr:dolichyl-phosphate beta-glucosyltransferase [Terriglobales bacterium]
MQPVRYSIVVPAYNESQRIVRSLESILAFLTRENWKAEVIVVNDGSRDNTAEIVRDFMRQHPGVRLLENPGNRGKGYSVRHGMLEATGDLLLFTDADLSSPIEEAPKLFQAIHEGADIAIGSRWLQAELQKQRQPLYRQLFGRIFNLLLRAILGLNFKDTQCGFKAFTRQAAQDIFPRQLIDRWGFDPEILFLARKQGLRIQELGVEWAHDERSKINPLTDGFKMFLEILRIRGNYLAGKYQRTEASYAAGKSA